jgi:hypothetical protein
VRQLSGIAPNSLDTPSRPAAGISMLLSAGEKPPFQ